MDNFNNLVFNFQYRPDQYQAITKEINDRIYNASHFNHNDPPILISGKEGIGKTAFIKPLVLYLRKTHKKVIFVYISCPKIKSRRDLLTIFLKEKEQLKEKDIKKISLSWWDYWSLNQMSELLEETMIFAFFDDIDKVSWWKNFLSTNPNADSCSENQKILEIIYNMLSRSDSGKYLTEIDDQHKSVNWKNVHPVFISSTNFWINGISDLNFFNRVEDSVEINIPPFSVQQLMTLADQWLVAQNSTITINFQDRLQICELINTSTQNIDNLKLILKKNLRPSISSEKSKKILISWLRILKIISQKNNRWKEIQCSLIAQVLDGKFDFTINEAVNHYYIYKNRQINNSSLFPRRVQVETVKKYIHELIDGGILKEVPLSNSRYKLNIPILWTVTYMQSVYPIDNHCIPITSIQPKTVHP
ncbi:hypothetical protein [Candidatus Lokiarchaeum ossiferum]|uniref:hypothetical protein n=1 Tax=Candidatus Lokiarchaeum ossiferum TaxID=2951803 RepID=UPI00352BF42B